MTKRNGRDLDPLMVDQYVSGRIRALVFDLVNDDWSMALQDLARLYRALKTGPSTGVDEPTGRTPPEVVGASIYYDDNGTTVEEFCDGPDEQGNCRLAEKGRPVACAGKRLATRGWDFAVAADADLCPLLALGLVKRHLDASWEEARQPRSGQPTKEVEHV
jgi:hypothetical protein